MSGQDEEGGITRHGIRKVTKDPHFANRYGKPLSGKEVTVLIADDPAADGANDGGVAQVTSASDWYALANNLAEKALADAGGRDAETNGPVDRGNEEV